MPADAIFDALDPVMTRWTRGGQAASLAPPQWGDLVGGANLSDQELRLLALTGQYLGLCVAPTPASALSAVPDIPVLALPVLPDTLAPLARRSLRALRESGGQRHLAHLLATRGYVIHPADWMPSRNDDAVPDVYAPWRDWAEVQAAQGGAGQEVHDQLTEANWNDWWPAARRIALKNLRAHDPARATAVLAAKAAGEAAEARFRLIECLSTGLSEADVTYLESLSRDRAPKIKALAVSLLARLGHGSGTQDDGAELADFFEFQTKGLLRRTRILVPRPIKTPAQRSRRAALFAQVDYAGFASALGVSAEDLVSFWPFGADAHADQGFGMLAELTASAVIIDALSARLMQEVTLDVAFIHSIQTRLDDGKRDAFARRVLADKGGSFAIALQLAGAGMEMQGLTDTVPGKALIAACTGDVDISAEVQALALIASQAAARSALERLTKAGLMASDPCLDLLQLNAALNDNGAKA